MSNIWKQRRRAISRLRRKSAAAKPASTPQAVRDHSEDEQLAAFLDGRLNGSERSSMMVHLAEADEAFEVFVRTAALLSEGDALLARMQTAEVRAATRRAFAASPDDLRKAAIKAARSSEE